MMDNLIQKSKKKDRIGGMILQKVLNGTYCPGQKLPPRKDLVTETGTAWVTVHRAFERLQREGVVRSVSGHGTFVTERPPCLYRIGIVVPPDNPQLVGGVADAMWRVAQEMERGGPFSFRKYSLAMTEQFRNADEDLDGPRLLADIKERRLAGIIFAQNPWPIAYSEILQQKRIPMNAMMSSRRDPYKHVVAMYSGREDELLKIMLKKLTKAGGKRVALLMPPTHYTRKTLENIHDLCVKCGLETRPYWCQRPDYRQPQWTMNCVELLMRLPEHDRPDCMAILDDSLTESAALGLKAAGVRVPEDLKVVAHANFPLNRKLVQPFVHVGIDHYEILVNAIRSLRLPQGLRKTAPDITFPIRDESEINPARFLEQLRMIDQKVSLS